MNTLFKINKNNLHIWDIHINPDDSALALVTSDWVRIYPFSSWQVQIYDFELHSFEVPFEISSTGPITWRSRPNFFTADSRFLHFRQARPKGHAHLSLYMTSTIPIYTGFTALETKSTRLLQIVGNTPCFDGPDKKSKTGSWHPIGEITRPPLLDNRVNPIISRSPQDPFVRNLQRCTFSWWVFDS